MAKNLINVRVNINRQALDGVIAKMPAGEAFLAELGADAVVEGAKARAPVVTGHLKGSIKKTGSGSTWIVFAEAAYSAYVEFGTRFMSAIPFLRPALEAVRWGDLIKQFLGRIGL